MRSPLDTIRSFIGQFGAVSIYETRMFGTYRVQVRFPRSKSKRIRRKWAKRPENYAVKWKRSFFPDGRRVFVDPDTYAEIKRLAEVRDA